mmetsp:Transcript_130583/g.225827  ORF Transcript_130583/g.225827 Transcript_130583/m.225827 type:complete len:93 (+) Transcript_130583:2538-2816(+)
MNAIHDTNQAFPLFIQPPRHTDTDWDQKLLFIAILFLTAQPSPAYLHSHGVCLEYLPLQSAVVFGSGKGVLWGQGRWIKYCTTGLYSKGFIA